MCFETAKLADGVRRITTSHNGAEVLINKTDDIRAAIIKFGGSAEDGSFEYGNGGGDHSQYVEPDDLRELAAEFNKLADELEA